MSPIPARVAAAFGMGAAPLTGRPTGSGHIHDTFLVRGEGGAAFVFQRVNRSVFPDIDALMDNTSRVLTHLRAKVSAEGLDGSRRVPTLLQTAQGHTWVADEAGSPWRAFPYIEGTAGYDHLTGAAQAFEAAKAFGDFVRRLDDLPGPPPVPTIPLFHDGPDRRHAFARALRADAFGRVAQARAEIDFLQRRLHLFDVPAEQAAAGRLPERVTHNDTKVNNVLFDVRTGEALCVIDLDTVMPGLTAYDFGDLVRTSIGTLAEDAPAPARQALRPDIFPALVRGYLAGMGEVLTESECRGLVFSGVYMSLLIGTRFLTDYLSGDAYFRTSRPGHNLDRCRVQFSLVSRLEDEAAGMEQVVARLWRARHSG